MLNKFNQVLMIIFIISVIGAAVLWFMSRPPQFQYDPLPTLNTNSDKDTPTQQAELNVQDIITEAPVVDDTDDIVEVMKTVFTEEQIASPEFQKFAEIAKSEDFKTFMETETITFGSVFDFFQAKGLPVSKEQMFDIFMELTPAGTPEQLEQRARIKLSTQFQNIPYDIKSPQGTEAFQNIVTAFLEDQENTAWMMTHFQGDFLAFGEWTVNVLRNPVKYEQVSTRDDIANVKPQVNPNTEKNDNIVEPSSVRNKPNDSEQVEIDKPINEPPAPEISDQDIDKIIQDELSSQDFSQQQIHRGMQLIILFGEVDGIDRIRRNDPDLAAFLKGVIENRGRRNK